MLCLTVLPVLGVWSYSVYMLSDTISLKSENEAVRKYRFIYFLLEWQTKKNYFNRQYGFCKNKYDIVFFFRGKIHIVHDFDRPEKL